MKKLLLAFMVMPLFLFAQDDAPDLMFENVIITPQPDKVKAFETKLAEHNKTFHADGAHACRVHYIGTGPNTGKYLWSMGPTTWESLDNRPANTEHDDHWNSVIANCTADAHASYWSWDREHSHVAMDFDLKHLNVMYVDVKRNGYKEMVHLLKQIKPVQAKYYNDEPYGVYWNNTASTSEGKDMAVIWFFDSWGWMGRDNNWTEKFNEMYGDGAWDRWMDDFINATDGVENELWTYREDLSGLGSKVPASDRQ